MRQGSTKLIHLLVLLMLGSCCCGSSLLFLGALLVNQQIRSGPIESSSEMAQVDINDDAMVEGIVQTEEPAILGQLQDGCKVKQNEELEWMVETPAAVTLEVQTEFGPVLLKWLAECPEEGAIIVENPEKPGTGWKGLAEGTEIMARVDLRSRDPIVFEVEDYATGDSIDEWRSNVSKPEVWGMACSGLLILGCFVLTYILVSGPNARVQWAHLAKNQGWQFQRGALSPGSIRGHIAECSFEMERMGRLGDAGILPGRIAVRLFLPEHLPSGVVDPLIYSAGLPPSASTYQVARNLGLHHLMGKLPEMNQSLESRPGQLILIVQGMGPKQVNEGISYMTQIHRLLQEVALSDLKQLAAYRSWKIELGLEWKVYDTFGRMVIHYRPQAPVRYEFSLPLPTTAPAKLRIRPINPASPGIQLADPILGQFVSMDSTEPERLRALLRQPLATERVMDLVKGHGGEVVDGCIRVVRTEFVPSPQPTLVSMEALAELLSAESSSEEST